MSYKRGISSEVVQSSDILNADQSTTVPVYIGTAPIETLEQQANVINNPILVSSFEEAKQYLGYSEDFSKYTLCEAIAAHFNNPLGNIGPIVLINVFDPEVHENVEAVTQVDIIGALGADGVRTGLACVDLVYQKTNQVPTILAAPGFSHIKEVYEALEAKSKKINGHWDAICVVDLDASSATNTITKAVSEKTSKSVNSKQAKVCWPKGKFNNLIFNLSTLTIARMQFTDLEIGENVPYVSPSNKQIMCDSLVLEDGTEVNIDELQANVLNASGITTAIFTGGNWKLWGPHNANFNSTDMIAAEEKFDASIRMMQYLSNMFQLRYQSELDSSISRRDIERILDDARVWLNGLISEGKLLYADVSFVEKNNSTTDLVNGDFKFDVATTTTPIGKSISFKIKYTSEGLANLFGGAE